MLNFDKVYSAEWELRINKLVRFLERGRHEVCEGKATYQHLPTQIQRTTKILEKIN